MTSTTTSPDGRPERRGVQAGRDLYRARHGTKRASDTTKSADDTPAASSGLQAGRDLYRAKYGRKARYDD